jgi:hypothetical protein
MCTFLSSDPASCKVLLTLRMRLFSIWHCGITGFSVLPVCMNVSAGQICCFCALYVTQLCSRLKICVAHYKWDILTSANFMLVFPQMFLVCYRSLITSSCSAQQSPRGQLHSGISLYSRTCPVVPLGSAIAGLWWITPFHARHNVHRRSCPPRQRFPLHRLEWFI